MGCQEGAAGRIPALHTALYYSYYASQVACVAHTCWGEVVSTAVSQPFLWRFMLSRLVLLLLAVPRDLCRYGLPEAAGPTVRARFPAVSTPSHQRHQRRHCANARRSKELLLALSVVRLGGIPLVFAIVEDHSGTELSWLFRDDYATFIFWSVLSKRTHTQRHRGQSVMPIGHTDRQARQIDAD